MISWICSSSTIKFSAKTKSFSISNEGDNVFVTEPLSFNLSNAENNFLQEEDSYVCYLQQKAQEKGEELSNFWKSNFKTFN